MRHNHRPSDRFSEIRIKRDSYKTRFDNNRTSRRRENTKNTNTGGRHGSRSASVTSRQESAYPMFRGQDGLITAVGAITKETSRRGRQQEREGMKDYEVIMTKPSGAKREHSEIASKSPENPRPIKGYASTLKTSPSKIGIPKGDDDADLEINEATLLRGVTKQEEDDYE